MAKLIIVAALMLAISMMTNNATDATGPITERRTLYTACAPMNFFVVGPDPENSQKIGLTEQAVENAVESRLRTARLYAPPAKQERVQYLYVVTTIVGPAFHLQVELKRRLDLGYGHTGYATVWTSGTVGTHGGQGQYLLGVVSKHLDRFIASYLRVNEAHCSR